MSEPNNVFQFKILLLDLEPPVWRRIQVPDNYTFWDLHVAVQDVMGWQHDHLHEFDMPNPETGLSELISIPMNDPGEQRIVKGWERNIKDYFTLNNNKAIYRYDFGDDWIHEIRLENIFPCDRTVIYPLCLDGARACPPEDCGGVFGYEHILEILADPKHEEHEETRQWIGEEFDPEHFDKNDVCFSGPEARLTYQLMEEDPDEKIDEYQDDEEDDDWDDEIDPFENAYGPLKKLNRDLLHTIWEKAKADDLDDLEPEHRQLGKIMQEHADEFFNAFEFGDLTYDHEYDPDKEVNPFLHIMIHAGIENQLRAKDPIEVYQFYNAMRQKKVSHHDTLHLLGAILMPLVFECVRQKRPFNNEAYRLQLKKYKSKNPKKIGDLLEKEYAV